MKYGFVKVAAASPQLKVADVKFNTLKIEEEIARQTKAGTEILVFPELSLCGYTCGDLFFSDCLLGAVEPALAQIVEASKGLYPVTAVGLPLRFGGKLYNCAAVIHAGQLLGVVPKTHLPNYGEFYEPFFQKGAGCFAKAADGAVDRVHACAADGGGGG